jgi:hypothetical protein
VKSLRESEDSLGVFLYLREDDFHLAYVNLILKVLISLGSTASFTGIEKMTFENRD